MWPRSFTAFCQTVTAACGKIAPREGREKKYLCMLLPMQVGVWGGGSLRQREKEMLPERHRVRYNTTEPCFQCQAFWLCRFLLAIINGFYYAIRNPLHRLASWLEELPAASVPASPVQTCHAFLPDIFSLCQFPHHHGSQSVLWAHFWIVFLH